MITRTQSFQTSDDTIWPTIEDAQAHEIELLGFQDSTATAIMGNSEKLIDILTTGPNSKPKARKANGGTKVRKAKTSPAQSTSEMPSGTEGAK